MSFNSSEQNLIIGLGIMTFAVVGLGYVIAKASSSNAPSFARVRQDQEMIITHPNFCSPMGYVLRSAVLNGELTQEQAQEIWRGNNSENSLIGKCGK